MSSAYPEIAVTPARQPPRSNGTVRFVDDEQCQQHHTDVGKGALRLEDGARGRGRPGRREQRPAAEREQEREEGEVEPTEPAAASGDEDRRRRHECQRRRPGPALGEVASLGRGDPCAEQEPEQHGGDPIDGHASWRAAGWRRTRWARYIRLARA